MGEGREEMSDDRGYIAGIPWVLWLVLGACCLLLLAPLGYGLWGIWNADKTTMLVVVCFGYFIWGVWLLAARLDAIRNEISGLNGGLREGSEKSRVALETTAAAVESVCRAIGAEVKRVSTRPLDSASSPSSLPVSVEQRLRRIECELIHLRVIAEATARSGGVKVPEPPEWFMAEKLRR